MANLPVSVTQDDEMSLDSTTSIERQEVENILMSIKNDLLEGIKEGIDSEIQSVGPEYREQIELNQEYLKQILEAIEEGMVSEIREFVSSEKELNDETIKEITERLSEISTRIVETPIPQAEVEPAEDVVPREVPKQRTVTAQGPMGFLRDVLLTSVGLEDFSEKLNERPKPEKFSDPLFEDSQEERFFEEGQKDKAEFAEVKKQTVLLTEIRDYAKLLENQEGMIPDTQGSNGEGSGFNFDLGTRSGRGALSRLGSLATRVALPAAAVGTAGLAGYKAGEILNDQVLNPLAGSITGDENDTVGTALFKGVDAVKGIFGNSEEDKMMEADRASELELAKRKLSAGEPISKNLADKVRNYGLEVPDEMIVDPSSRTVPLADSLSQGEELVGATTDRTSKLMDSGEVSSLDAAKEIGKNIVVQAPPPVVIPQTSSTPVIMPPFTSNIRNNESTMSDYIRRRFRPH